MVWTESRRKKPKDEDWNKPKDGKLGQDKDGKRDESCCLEAYKECAEARETTKAKLQATGQRIMCNDVQDPTWT